MFEGEVAHRLLERLRLSRWLRLFPARLVWAVFVFCNGFLAVALLAGLAVVSHTPFVFPSVGPTAFLLYFMPTAPTKGGTISGSGTSAASSRRPGKSKRCSSSAHPTPTAPAIVVLSTAIASAFRRPSR